MPEPSLALLLLAGSLPAGVLPTHSPGDVRQAITKSITLMESSREEYTTHRSCFSCHHQGVPAFALSLARSRGLAVDADGWAAQAKFTAEFLRKDKERYTNGSGPGGQADTAGSALFALQLADFQDDAITGPIVEYLLKRDEKRGHWVSVSGNRPPTQGSPFSTTFYAVRGIQSFAGEVRKERADARIAKAREWLVKTPGKDTEDRVFRLWALKLVGADAKVVQGAAAELLRTQRGDGGWSQNDSMMTDAYSTGSALVALHESGALNADTWAYRRGMGFLVRSQLADGSWRVKVRAKPIQKYFESGYPHGVDQFVSVAAAGWATAALILGE